MADNSNYADGDYFETTEYEGYGSRIKHSFGGLCFGPILMVISVVVLVWNEGRNMHRLQDLREAQPIVFHVNDISSIDSSKEGKLLHLSGDTETDDDLYDQDFGIQSSSAIHLKRSVETYQWVEKESTRETKTNSGGTKRTTSYTYERIWNTDIENSNQFYRPDNHENPENPLFEDISYDADSVTLGAYQLSYDVISKMNWYEPYDSISADTVQVDTGYAVSISQNRYFYFGDDSSNPQVGDTRVSFSIVPTGTVSMVAEQSGAYLTSYATSRGGSILLLQKGYASSAELFAKAELENAILTWVLRAVGYVASFIGLSAMMQPISVLVDIVPFVGELVDMGLTCVAFIVSLTISSTVIAIAWLFYRPLVGGSLLLIIGGIVYCILIRAKRHQGSTSNDPAHEAYGTYGGGNYEQQQYQEQQYYPTSYQQQHQQSGTAIPFAQALDSPFAQQTSSSPALNAPVLGPPVLAPPDVPVVYKPDFSKP